MERENLIDKKAERQKLTGLFLIMLILLYYALSLLYRVFNRTEEAARERTRKEQIIQKRPYEHP